MTLFLIAFIAGILTILAPCILPLLPVVVGGSLTDGKVNKRKAITVVLSLGISVIAFTFLLKVSTVFINVPQVTWQWISGGIIIIFGLVTIFPDLWEKIPIVSKISRSSNKALSSGYQKKSVWGDIIIGASLGPVFTTCSPTYFIVLATVLPSSLAKGLIDMLAYVIGLSIALFVVALLGQKITQSLGAASDPKGIFKKTLGVVFLIIGVAVLVGWDKKIESALLSNSNFDITKVEQKLLENNTPTPGITTSENSSQDVTGKTDTNTNMSDNKGNQPNNSANTGNGFLTMDEKKKLYPVAPDISTPDGFINTNGKPINISDYRGKKVVLLDIWTYSCINCQRTIPYLNAWYDKYEKDGLVIIGLHTPEFSFERVQKNVEDAVKQFGIKYPVVLDNDYSTWKAYGNQYWPRKYLIDMDGYIVYDHIGEGQYDETERQIQKALKELDYRLNMPGEVDTTISSPKDVVSLDSGKLGSPETYFGSARNQYLANGERGVSGVQTLILPDVFQKNLLYLGGTWNFIDEYARNQGEADIVFRYNAKNVYLVGSSDTSAEIEVYEDGNLVGQSAGADIDKTTGTGVVKEDRLYKIIEGADYGEHLLRIHIKSGGLKAFTFTFG